MGGGDAVGGHLHRPSAGNGSTVGGPTTTTGGLCALNRLQGRRKEEIYMMDAGEDRVVALVHTIIGNVGGPTHAAGRGRGSRSLRIKVREAYGQ